MFRSDPSLNNSCEILSIREDSASVSNASSKGSEKANEKIAARFYPEALGSSSYIEKNGQISLTVIVQTINQVRTLCVGFGSSPRRPASHAFLKPLVLLGSFTNFSKGWSFLKRNGTGALQKHKIFAFHWTTYAHILGDGAEQRRPPLRAGTEHRRHPATDTYRSVGDVLLSADDDDLQVCTALQNCLRS